MSSVRASICGLGGMGRDHLRVSQDLNFDIVSTYDPMIKSNKYSTYLKTLLKCDALIIANPTKHHIKTILDAKSINPKLKILCEKPITLMSNDKLIKDVIQYNSSVLIGQVERFNPVCQKAIEIFDVDSIIQIKTTRVNHSPPKEEVHCRKDIGIHDLDFCCSIMKELPTRIDICSTNNYYHEILLYKIKNASIVNELSWVYPYQERTFEVLVDSGIYYGDFYNQSFFFKSHNGQRQDILVNKREPLANELLHLKDMVVNNTSPIVTIENNLSLLELL